MSRALTSLFALSLAGSVLAQNSTPDVKVETAKLRAAAEAKAKEIGKLTAQGNLTSSDDALKLLQQAVDELKEIRERLKTLEAAQGVTAKTVSQGVGKLKVGGYAHFQYTDTDKKGQTRYDAFSFRRLRISFEGNTSPRVSEKFSFDLATGTNTLQEQLRDAWITYDMSGGSRLGRDRAYAGQFSLPLGYELERSDADNEFPERLQFSQIYFNTERSRGLKVRHEDKGVVLQAGVVDALTINDPEQAALAPGAGDRLAFVGQAKLIRGNTSVGVSAFSGDRPTYTAAGATSPEVHRKWGFLDAEQRHLFWKGLTLRGEVYRGNDRIPSATAKATNVGHPIAGYDLQGIYQLSSLDRLTARYENLDPNTDASGNAIRGYGFAYLRNLTPELLLTLSHEIFVDESRAALGQTRYGLTTLRLQVKF